MVYDIYEIHKCDATAAAVHAPIDEMNEWLPKTQSQVYKFN